MFKNTLNKMHKTRSSFRYRNIQIKKEIDKKNKGTKPDLVYLFHGEEEGYSFHN